MHDAHVVLFMFDMLFWPAERCEGLSASSRAEFEHMLDEWSRREMEEYASTYDDSNYPF